jgi:hypothetical protein
MDDLRTWRKCGPRLWTVGYGMVSFHRSVPGYHVSCWQPRLLEWQCQPLFDSALGAQTKMIFKMVGDCSAVVQWRPMWALGLRLGINQNDVRTGFPLRLALETIGPSGSPAAAM